MGTTGKAVVILIVLIALGVGVWLAAPLFYDKEVSEDLPESVETLREGQFRGADSSHQGSGTARIVEANGKKYVRFEEDFQVTNGPDLFVYFGRDGTYDKDTNIGRLKGSKGSQNYEIPSDINVDDYNEVWVWCRAFAVPFAKAVLR